MLLGTLFFNWFGYRLVVSCLQDRDSRKLEARLDENNYDESQLISVKVPMTHLSYYNLSSGYERVNGFIELNGVRYKYVKRRLYNDSLELLCLPDHAAMKWQAFNKRQGGHIFANKLPIADPYVFQESAIIPERSSRWVRVHFWYRTFLPSGFLPADERPPAIRA